MAPSEKRNYEKAVEIIESRQRQARPKLRSSKVETLSPMPSSSGTPGLKGVPGIVGMSEWLDQLGYSHDTINRLSVIHVAGTKGKGSTCAFAESFLRARGKRTGFPLKTGLYTSPHLIVPEERIRIDSLPLHPTLFANYFFEIYDKLPQLAQEYDPSRAVVERGPRSLQLYALLALHVFIREKVDVAIIETHSGGEYDATNLVRRPIVTAITSLGLDHVQTLGPSIDNIAWHKSGIFKQGAAALSTVQDSGAAKMLSERAAEAGEALRFIDENSQLPMESLQLKPIVQKKNASLAVACANAFLQRMEPANVQSLTTEDLHLGVAEWKWPGRFQTIPDDQRTWFLDAAHNEMSIQIAASWFVESSMELSASATRVLVFTHISEHRDAAELLRSLANALRTCTADISHVIFTSYSESEASHDPGKAERSTLFNSIWKATYPDTRIWNESTVTDAVQAVKRLSARVPGDGMHILITGSQHLIGPVLRILESKGTRQGGEPCISCFR